MSGGREGWKPPYPDSSIMSNEQRSSFKPHSDWARQVYLQFTLQLTLIMLSTEHFEAPFKVYLRSANVTLTLNALLWNKMV